MSSAFVVHVGRTVLSMPAVAEKFVVPGFNDPLVAEPLQPQVMDCSVTQMLFVKSDLYIK